MPQMTYFTLEPPVQWLAGYSGSGPSKTPFYFDCADCDAKEPPIAGVLGTGPTFYEIARLRKPGSFFVKAAMFCETCYAKRLETAAPLQTA